MSQLLHSVLEPAGPQAGRIYTLWVVTCWISIGVFVVVAFATAAAVVRGCRNHRQRLTAGPSEMAVSTAVALAIVVTSGILFVLLGASVSTGQALNALGEPGAVSIAITGHQWWWEIAYEDALPSRRVTTANEIHIPVGRPVVFKMSSHDVIHSFWVPSLHGKRDLIPGMSSAIWLQADRPGRYRGQCAEFCGLQHAHMAFEVVAESDDEFGRWLDAQRHPAEQPNSEQERRGEAVFVTGRCAMCHRVRGTPAYGSIGPELTHVASRRMLAAGTLPNSRGHLAGWVVDPQTVKPGTAMPPTPLTPDDLQDLIAYLEVLR